MGAGATGGSRRGGADGGQRCVEDRRSIGDAVGRGGDLGLVRDRTDRAQRLSRLSVGLDHPACIGVNSWEVLVCTLARLECTILGGVGGVVGASNTVVNVLAVVGSVRTSWVTNLEAENATAHEIVPLDDLLEAVVVSARPTGGVDETSERVTTEVGAVRVQFSSRIVGLKVDQRLVDETNDLEIVRSLHKLNTLEGTSGDQTSAITGLGAPGDFFSFCITDGLGAVGRCPKTEI